MDTTVEALVAEQTPFALTTLDNPYSPHTDYKQWWSYDRAKGYHTCELMGRVTIDSHANTEKETYHNILTACYDIIDNDPTGKYYLLFENMEFKPAI